ncbi:NIMA related kinase 1, putative [Plasmodium vinckei]|uniref:non-specific serine/threonine protein kinase n=1 Tax=Plasmodium vinckei TaxID=5860 RepID=A0A6V7TFF6_PLAVN|nr:NIMA related kinase 1, putative [Plasmodium vinckei]
MPSKYDDGENRLNEYEVIKKIGNGRFGEVFLVKHKRTQEFFCWKAISYRGLKEREKSQLVIEVNVMRELKHKNIVRYIDRFLNKANQKLYILMEFCDAGDLSRNIQKCYKMFGKIEEHAIVDITRQLLHALAYCHNLKDGPNGERVLHRDLKPQNIFLSTGIRHIGKITAQANNLNSKPIAKIGDFGLSKNIGIESMAHSCVGTPYYWSPELLLHETKSYDDKSDMWALGCIIYELCSGKTPFHKANNFAQLISELKKGPELPIKGKSKELNFLIKNLLNLSAKERPSALQCLGYQIIKNVTPSVGNRRDNTCTELTNTNNCKAIEPKSYIASQNALINKRTNEHERPSSCVSRQVANTLNKDNFKYNKESNINSHTINGKYINKDDKIKIYDIEKEKMQRELLEREKLERNRIEKETAQRKAMEIKILEKKQIERERMERIERDKKDRLERERVERERIERERIERERIERERIERERVERERIERERVEKERVGRVERERLERERMQRIEKERIERLDREKMQQKIERAMMEKTRREKYFYKERDTSNSSTRVDSVKNGSMQPKNPTCNNTSYSRIKETYDHINNYKEYIYDNRKKSNYEDTYDKCSMNTYIKNNTGNTTLSSKNMHSYNSNGTRINNNYVASDCYSGYNNNNTISQYSNNCAESIKFKNDNSNKYQINMSKNAQNHSRYNEDIDSGYRTPPYEINYNDKKTSNISNNISANISTNVSSNIGNNISSNGSNSINNNSSNTHINNYNNGERTCRSSRISNVYFNDNARRSVSAIPHVNNNISRRKSSVQMFEDESYSKPNADDSRSYKNLEKDREYLLEKRKLLLEKEKEIYELIKHSNNYNYSNMQRYERCENIGKTSDTSRRNKSLTICMNDQAKRASYNSKRENDGEESDYVMKNRNIYTLKNLVHNNGDDIYDRKLYSCR